MWISQTDTDQVTAPVFPLVWGGSFAMIISGGSEEFLSISVTIFSVALMLVWYRARRENGLGKVKKGVPELYIAGLLLWLYGYLSGHNAATAAGITLTGAGVCSCLLFLAPLVLHGRHHADAQQAESANRKSLIDMSASLVRKTPDGGYEINIHELADAISRGKAGREKSCGPSRNPAHRLKSDGKQENASAPSTVLDITERFQPQTAEVKTILEQYLSPWIKEQDIAKGIACLLKILDVNAKEPSVIVEERQLSQGEPYDIHYEALSRITISEHTLHVVEEGFAVTKNRFGETGLFTVWPRLVCCMIAHDLGKIPGIRVEHDYAKLDHPAASAALVKECLEHNLALSEECSEIVLHHHGEPPAGFAYVQGLELLKEADARARRKELQQTLRHLKPWQEIPLESVAEELVSAVLDIIKAGDTVRDLFCLNPKQGFMYVNPDVLIGILQSISRDTYLWPEIFSPDSRMAEKALLQFMDEKLKPAGLLTQNFSKDRFLWLKIKKPGKVTGPRPFVEIGFMKFIQVAGITPSEIVGPWRKSFLGKCRVVCNSHHNGMKK